MKQKWKQKLAYIGAVIVLFSFIHDHKYDPHYEILENSDAFASYSGGLVYIGDQEFLDSITPNEGDILVGDYRFDHTDPEYEVYDSYKIHGREARNEILEILQEYERLNPSPWDRSMESLRLEMFFHYYSHYFGYEIDRSGTTDLNNRDEEKYDNKILRKLFWQ